MIIQIMKTLILSDLSSFKKFAITCKQFHEIYKTSNQLWKFIWEMRFKQFHKYIDILLKDILPFITWNNDPNVEGNPAFFWNANYENRENRFHWRSFEERKLGEKNILDNANYKDLIKLVLVKIPIYLGLADSEESVDFTEGIRGKWPLHDWGRGGYFIKIDENGIITNGFTIIERSDWNCSFDFCVMFFEKERYDEWEGNVDQEINDIYGKMANENIYNVLHYIPLFNDKSVAICQTRFYRFFTNDGTFKIDKELRNSYEYLLKLLRFQPIFPKEMFILNSKIKNM